MQNIPSKKIRISQKRLISLINDCNPSKDPVEQEKVEKLKKIFDPDPNFNVLDFLEEIDLNLDNYQGEVFFQKVLPSKKTIHDPKINKYHDPKINKYRDPKINKSHHIKKSKWVFQSKQFTQLVYAADFPGNRFFYRISMKGVIQFHTSRLRDFFDKQKEIDLNFDKETHSTNIFYMKKRSGGYRKIYVPNENLRNEQIKIKRVLDDLLYQIEKSLT